VKGLMSVSVSILVNVPDIPVFQCGGGFLTIVLVITCLFIEGNDTGF
jgi:hypothetical protein